MLARDWRVVGAHLASSLGLRLPDQRMFGALTSGWRAFGASSVSAVLCCIECSQVACSMEDKKIQGPKTAPIRFQYSVSQSVRDHHEGPERLQETPKKGPKKGTQTPQEGGEAG